MARPGDRGARERTVDPAPLSFDPVASGTAVVAVVSLIAVKHLALAIAAGSPLAALFQILKPKVRPYCPWAPKDND